MFVKITRTGQRVVQATAEAGDTDQDVLDSFDVEYAENDSITVDGVTASLNTALTNNRGDLPLVIVLSAAVKGGGPFLVKIGTSGGAIHEYQVESGWTVAQAVAITDPQISAEGKSITVNGRAATTGTVLNGTETLILLTASVKGGN